MASLPRYVSALFIDSSSRSSRTPQICTSSRIWTPTLTPPHPTIPLNPQTLRTNPFRYPKSTQYTPLTPPSLVFPTILSYPTAARPSPPSSWLLRPVILICCELPSQLPSVASHSSSRYLGAASASSRSTQTGDLCQVFSSLTPSSLVTT